MIAALTAIDAAAPLASTTMLFPPAFSGPAITTSKLEPLKSQSNVVANPDFVIASVLVPPPETFGLPPVLSVHWSPASKSKRNSVAVSVIWKSVGSVCVICSWFPANTTLALSILLSSS